MVPSSLYFAMYVALSVSFIIFTFVPMWWISTEERNGVIGNYTAVVYNRQAQQFIVDNIDAIITTIFGSIIQPYL